MDMISIGMLKNLYLNLIKEENSILQYWFNEINKSGGGVLLIS